LQSNPHDVTALMLLNSKHVLVGSLCRVVAILFFM
jgi:hypothetical protein